jgi:uncharacterized protein
MTADDVIRLLDLEPHPEGGHYREMFRDTRLVQGRAASTAIYFLLRAGERSRWHRVDAVEVWHWYAGDALRLTTWAEGSALQKMRLGPKLNVGERPQAVVPAGAWQTAAPANGWTLVGCTVAPGFEFSGFELAPEGWDPMRLAS